MERVKRIVRRAVLVAGLLLGTAFVGDRPARAQFAVTDLPQIGVHITNYATQLLKFLEQLGISKEEYEWLYDIYDVAMSIGDFIKEVGVEVRLVKSLERQTEALARYSQRVVRLGVAGFNPYMLQSMKNRIDQYLRTLKRMLDQAMKILADPGLTKGEKVTKSKELAETLTETGNKMSDDLATELVFLDSAWGSLQFINFLNGDPANQSLEDIGVYGGEIAPAVVEPALEEERSVIKDSFEVVYVILGILLALSLIGITVRFMRGDWHSEYGFARIFVVIVAAAVLFSVLHSVMGL